MNTAFSVIEPGSLRAEIMEIVYCGELNKILLISTWLTLKWSTNSNRNTQSYISSAPIHRINILTLSAFQISPELGENIRRCLFIPYRRE